jgi:hypothetical protein
MAFYLFCSRYLQAIVQVKYTVTDIRYNSRCDVGYIVVAVLLPLYYSLLTRWQAVGRGICGKHKHKYP